MWKYWAKRLIRHFDPFLFVMVMATGISSNLLHGFTYEARWLRYCSYPMFALACLLFLYLQALQFLHMFIFIREKSFKEYFNEYFRNPSHNVFWGMYPMGLTTIVNYIVTLALHEVKNLKHAKRMMMLAYILWWYVVVISLLCAWGISFLIWQKCYYAEETGQYRTSSHVTPSESVKCVLLLLVIPIVVAASSSSAFTMTDLFAQVFDRNIQLMVLIVTTLLWLHAIIFVFIVIVIYFWSLYVNKMPAMGQVFTLFLLLGPMGQASYGILLLTEDVRLYVDEYYPRLNLNTDYDILLLTVPWCFKIFGLLSALALLAMGYFFTIVTFAAVASHYGTKVELERNGHVYVNRVYHFHRGWFAMTFPMGTMSLGSSCVYDQYQQYVPMLSFRVIGAIYGVICIVWTLICLTGIVFSSVTPELKQLLKANIANGSSKSESSTVFSGDDYCA